MTIESWAAMASFAAYGADTILRWPGVEEVAIRRQIDRATIAVRYSGHKSEIVITNAQLRATDNPWLLLKELRADIFAAAGVEEN